MMSVIIIKNHFLFPYIVEVSLFVINKEHSDISISHNIKEYPLQTRYPIL